MTQTQGRLFDEFAKLMNDAAGVAQGARREVETVFRAQGDRFISEMDIARREDVEIVREIAARALGEVERLTARVAELEARVAGEPPVTAAVPPAAAPGDAALGD